MNSPKIIDISNKFKKNIFSKENLLLPDCVHTTKKLSKYEYAGYSLSQQFDWDLFGSDCSGGFAYFGKTPSILKLQENLDTYLQKLDCGQYYARWDFFNYSVLLLYEDYMDSPDNPLPFARNVLQTKFGAWTDDHPLPDVLNNIKEWDTFFVGKQKFDMSKAHHVKLWEEFKKAVFKIHPEYVG